MSSNISYSILHSEEEEDLPIKLNVHAAGPSQEPEVHGNSDKSYGTAPYSRPPDLLVPERKSLHLQRSLNKNGRSNLTHTHIDHKDWSFFSDIFTTFLDAKWRWLLFAFMFTYFGTWLLFAGIWYSILYLHGDFDPVNRVQPSFRPCITKVTDFTSTFLFSVETQQTTGYGYYHLTEECPIAVITLCIQSIIGVIVEGLMVGLVFLKMARAKKRTATLRFSKNAVISKRDGQLCFMFRVADIRNKSHLLQATVRAQLITRRVTAEGEEIPISQQELEVGGDGEKGNELLLFWPTTVVHKINENSPLYKYSAEDFHRNNLNFEVIVVLEGIVESTGLLTQARSSYLPSEILWGARFKSLGHGKRSGQKSRTGERVIDYSGFNDTFAVPTSPESSYTLNALAAAVSTVLPSLQPPEYDKIML